MGLNEKIKEEEEELEKLNQDESIAKGDTPPAEDDNNEDDSSKGAPTPAEDDDNLNKEEEGDDKTTQEQTPNSISAQLRIERKQRKELQDAQDDLKARNAQLEEAIQQNKTKETVPDAAPQKDKLSADDRLDRIEKQQRHTQLVNDAINEFNVIEAAFSKETPDYTGASTHMISKMIQGIQYANPGVTEQQAINVAKNNILQIASKAKSSGLNPAETLYTMSFEHYGYKKEEDTKKSAKDSVEHIKKVQSNKKRSVNSLSGGGQSGSATVTLEEAGNMDMASFSKLSPSEIDQMIADAS